MRTCLTTCVVFPAKHTAPTLLMFSIARFPFPPPPVKGFILLWCFFSSFFFFLLGFEPMGLYRHRCACQRMIFHRRRSPAKTHVLPNKGRRKCKTNGGLSTAPEDLSMPLPQIKRNQSCRDTKAKQSRERESGKEIFRGVSGRGAYSWRQLTLSIPSLSLPKKQPERLRCRLAPPLIPRSRSLCICRATPLQ